MKHANGKWNASWAKDSTGKMLTLSLFKETCRDDVAAIPVFSLEDWHDDYVAIADPTEYRTALMLLGNWEHWCKLREKKQIAMYFDAWKREVEVKLRSEAIHKMKDHAQAPNGAAAAKWLAEGGFSGRDMRKTADKKEEEEVKDDVITHARRLGVIPGGKK